MVAVKLELEAPPIALLVLDVPHDPKNELGLSVLADLVRAVDELEADASIGGAILWSKKPRVFAEGFDPGALLGLETRADAEELWSAARAAIDRVRTAKKPIVAAVDGRASGAGFELCLACADRVATDDPRTAFALEAVRLGLAPWLGGPAELLRLCGLEKTLDVVLGGNDLSAADALSNKLVRSVVGRSQLLREARTAALDRIGAARADAPPRLGPRDREVLRTARAHHRATSGDHPAATSTIDILEAALKRDAAQGVEQRAFTELVISSGTRATLAVERAADGLERDAAEIAARTSLGPVAVVGATSLGARVAGALERAGVEVSLCITPDDASVERAAILLVTSRPTHARRSLVEALLQRGAPSAPVVVFDAVTPLDRSCPTDRARVFGLSVANDVAEIVVNDGASRADLDRTFTLARALARLAITVGDGVGRLGPRLSLAYVNEALHQLELGATREEIVGATEDWGFALDPFATIRRGDDLRDQGSALAAAIGGRLPLAASFRSLSTAAAPSGAIPRRTLPERRGGRVTPEDLMTRIALAVVNEAFHCLSEGIVRSEVEADVAMTRAIGFPRFRGGPFRYAKTLGCAELCDRLRRYEKSLGARFAPAPALIARA